MEEIKEQEIVIEPVDGETAPIVSADPEVMDEAPVTPNGEPEQDQDYLDSELFKDIRRVKTEDLGSADGEEEIQSELLEIYLNTFSDISENQLIVGRVIGMNEKEILIDIGFKSEGVIDRSEFTEEDLPKIGEPLEVYLEYLEDASGKTVLSKEKADFMRRWRELREVFEEGTIIEGIIERRIKGGMAVDLNGVQAFLPGSQIDMRPVRDFDKYVAQSIELKIVKLNEARKNVVVSHKAILEETMREQRDALFEDLKVGQIVEGRVKNITDFGAFIDLGGVDGLLHITDLTWGRVSNPNDVVQLDEALTIKIIDFDREKQRISLGLKQLTPHPWDSADGKYPEGTKINGRIVSMTNYGAFVELEPGVEGLIHVSEMSWTRHVKNPSEIYTMDERVEAIVLAVDSKERKISLGAKQLQTDPWDQIEDKYILGSNHKGKVLNLTQFGAFIELEEGIEGLVHISDLSWTRLVRHPREVLEKGQEVEVRIMEISRENRRISLGLKQITEDPWPELVSFFETSKEVEGEIIRVLDKGIILSLEKDVEGIIPFSRKTKRQRKTLVGQFEKGNSLKGIVVEVSPEEKKVILFCEEVGNEPVKSPEDEVESFLESQDEPAGEKLEIPENEPTAESVPPADGEDAPENPSAD